jgi:ABC-type branched-subunit amino acid transport system substrate-binding protein
MQVRRTSPRRTLIGVLAALAVVAGACSSDRDDDPTATGEGGDAGGADTTAASDDGGDSAFGDLESPCGEGDGEAAAGGASEQGVTADEVVIGYGDDAGFPTSPGLSHETSDAMRAMIDWCNEQGGINGRQIVGRYYDAAITDVVNAMTQACGEVFMLVGEAWALDSGQEETRLGCDLPAVPTYSVSPEFANAPLVYQSNPNPADIYPAGAAAQLAELFPDEVKKASVMFGNFAATIDTKDKIVQAYPEFGWEFLDCPQEYNIAGEPDWKPFAQRLKDCGAEIVYYLGQPYPNMQNLLDDAAQVDYRPVWVVDVNAYLQSFADWNTTGNGDNVYMRTSFTPFEQADDNPATQQYMEIVQGSGGDISQLAEQTTSSFLLWATAAKECGAELTRQCVVDELSQITSWTGGGLHQEANPGENMPPECFMILKLDGTSWVQAHPEEQGEFVCNPDSNVELTGRVVDQAELDENRVSTKYLP